MRERVLCVRMCTDLNENDCEVSNVALLSTNYSSRLVNSLSDDGSGLFLYQFICGRARHTQLRGEGTNGTDHSYSIIPPRLLVFIVVVDASKQ